MNGLIALSLSWLLGQTAPSTEPTEAQAASAVQAAQLEELRAQMELLQLQGEERTQQTQARLETLEQERAQEQEARQQAEQLRQQGLQSLARGQEWLATLDGLLEAGEDPIGPAVVSAQRELSDALASTADIGRGESARLIQSVLQRLGTLEDSVAQRNPDAARLQLFFASGELRSAWRMNLDQTRLPALEP
ncbi:hypothetical protein [Cystobacter ferrugineus]|uniref:Uncharacterized protein n=1 Tax=Cystobacter ferrugineus TaxID=83449 RepID=A0A1L9BAQ1_9BACT|nr:hypothetical protein [Cystobacter ferrugineus]OJH39311.1 hypothetical protein BON30_17495 [Cystobacter ferrugineus]